MRYDSEQLPAELAREDATVLILPKCPPRYGSYQLPQVVRISRLRTKPDDRTLETKHIFLEMFQSYPVKHHKHRAKGVTLATDSDTLVTANDTGSIPLCLTQSVYATNRLRLEGNRDPLAEDRLSSSDTSETSEDDTFSQASSALSSVTMQRDIRFKAMTTRQVLSRFTTCVSDVAGALVCSYAGPPREDDSSYEYTVNDEPVAGVERIMGKIKGGLECS